MRRLKDAFLKRHADTSVAADGGVEAKLATEMQSLQNDFDAEFYLEKYVDIRGLGIDPLMHYCLYGWQEGRDPRADFSTDYYLRSNSDVTELHINPFLHYVQEGRSEGRNSYLEADVSDEEHSARKEALRPEFDAPLYLQLYQDVAEADTDPLEHYYTSGWHEGRNPALGFSTAYYLATNPDVAASGVNPFWHYVTEGRAQGRNPVPPRAAPSDNIHYATETIRPEFDIAYYLNRYPDVAALYYDPVEHYCTTGWLEGRDPNPAFSTLLYLEAHADVAENEINPFLHYIQEGRSEGRAVAPAVDEDEPVVDMPVAEPEVAPEPEVEAEQPIGSAEDIRPYFDVAYFKARNPDLAESEIDPVEHYWTFGWKEGRDPAPWFSTQYYLEANPDVAAKAGVLNPFWHYVMSGKHEGRMPQHPGGYRVERLRHTEPLEQNVQRWLRKVPAPALMSAQDLHTAIGASCAVSSAALTLSVGHDHYRKVSGGVQLCIHQEEILSVAGVTYLNLHPWQPLPRMVHADEDPDPIMVLVMNGIDLGKARISDLTQAVADLRPDLRQTRVVIHHLLGHLPERIIEMVQATGQNDCWLWLHDFFTICPNYALQRNGIVYCDAPPVSSNACSLCRFGQERRTHLPRITALFAALNVHVISPSEVTMQFWPERTALVPASTTVLPHMNLVWDKRDVPLPVTDTDSMTIAFLGTPAQHKGWDIFEALIRKLGPSSNYRFVYLGTSKVTQPGLREVDVHVTADSPDAMIEAVRAEGCDLVLHWAAWPETFSFSTFEALAGGAYVLTNPISGNVAATVTRLERGAVLADEPALYEFFDSGAAAKLVTKLRQERAKTSIRHTLSGMATELWQTRGTEEQI